MIGLFDRRAVFQVIGGVLQNPTLLDEYTLTQEDFNGDSFHQIVFSSIYNLHNQGVSIIDCFALDSFISSYEKQYRIFTSNNGIDYVNDAISMCEPENFIYNYNRVKKFSLLRYYVSQNMDMIKCLNACRKTFMKTKNKTDWWQLIQLLPNSYNQKRTVMLNYEVLASMYHQRKNHKLDEWRTFCEWIKTLPCSELITGEEHE